jgi:hypothetical protein
VRLRALLWGGVIGGLEAPLERLSCVVFHPFWVAGRVLLRHLPQGLVCQSVAHRVFELVVGHDGPRRAGANSII